MSAVVKTPSNLITGALITGISLLCATGCQTTPIQHLMTQHTQAELWQSPDELDQMLADQSKIQAPGRKLYIGHTRKILIGKNTPAIAPVTTEAPEPQVSTHTDNWCNAKTLNIDFKSDRDYRIAVLKQVSSKWVKPRKRFGFHSCNVLVKTNIYGCVIDINVGMCEQNRVLKRSISSAVYRASPLPIRSEKDTLLEIKFNVAGTSYAGN